MNNKTISFLFSFALLFSVSLAVAQPYAPAFSPAEMVWNVDASHSNVGFTVTHLVISEVDGNFKVYDGSLTTTSEDFNNAKISFSVDVNSIDTDNESRDNHLKGDDFFNAAEYPNMTFASKSFKKIGDKTYKLIGDLTIRDITKQVTFDVTYGGQMVDPWGNTKAGFKASTAINRFDYNLRWDAATEAGSLVVGKEVTINLNLQFNLAK